MCISEVATIQLGGDAPGKAYQGTWILLREGSIHVAHFSYWDVTTDQRQLKL